MIRPKVLILLIFSILFISRLAAQSEPQPLSLISILNKAQERFKCTFSYVDNELKDVTLQAPSTSLNLKETITYLEQKTPFQYTFLTEKNIVLSFKNTKQHAICGILKSIETNSEIINATIQTTTRSLVSDADGKFSLMIDSLNEMITIDYLGYKTLRVNTQDLIQQPCKELLMIPEIQQLEEIVIQDYLIKGIGKKSDGSITIDYNDFGILPGLIEPDLLQTVQALPGIVSVDETVSNINVRGGTNDQNLILWDGIKMYQSGHFFGLISAYNPYLTKNVRLFKNGTSARYGDGVSSVIAMNTSNKINKDLEASIGANLISVDGYFDTSLGEKSSLQFAARKSISELLETPTYKQYFDKAFQNTEVIDNENDIQNSDDQFSFYDISLRWLYELGPKDLIKVNALIIRNDLIFQENTFINQIEVSRKSSAKQNNTAGGILYQRNWSSIFESELLLYGTNYNLEAINSDVLKNQRLLQENEVVESGFKLNTLLKAHPNLDIKSGYQFNETGIKYLRDVTNPTFRDLTKEVVRTNSIFSEIEYRSKNRSTLINMGLRANHFDKFNKFLIEPRLSYNQRFLNHFTLEILGEIKSQVTSQIIDAQNDFLGIENRRWVLSNNNDIPIIKSRQASVGLSYNHANWLINTEVFYKNVDGIYSLGQGFQGTFESEKDQGSYRVNGIDFLINKRFNNFSAWLSYSYAENKYQFDKLSETSFPNNLDIKHNLNIAFAYTIKSFKFSTGLNWHSGKPTTRPVVGNEINADNNINYQNINSDTLEDYFRLDLSSTYKFKISKKIKALTGISIWNMVNQENTINNFYRIKNQNDIEEVKQFGLELTPNVVFRINF